MDVVVLHIYVHWSESLKIWIVSIEAKISVSFSAFHCNFTCPISNWNATVPQSNHSLQKRQLILLNQLDWWLCVSSEVVEWSIDMTMWLMIIKRFFKNSRKTRAWPNHSVTNDKKTSSKPTIILFISISTLKKIKNKRVQKLRICLCNIN